MKRQRGRNRSGGGGGKPQHNSNRAFDSNGPDGIKVRGAAQHVYEKYQQLARDAHTAGDRVTAENYLQHAEHYFRVMRAMQPQRPVAEIIGRDQFASGYDIDFEDESAAPQPPEAEGEIADGERSREEYRGGEPRRDERPREDRFGVERFGGERNPAERFSGDRFAGERRPIERGQNERVQGERPAGERPDADRGQRGFQGERSRFRDDRGGRYGGRDISGRETAPMSQGEARPAVPIPAPGEDGRVLRADDGEVNHAPAFLQVRPVEARDDGQARAPRRRRPPRNFETPDGLAAPAEAGED
ncbi:MAG: DUF4167 domain-containing protein [Caulobacteraceae bacterium]